MTGRILCIDFGLKYIGLAVAHCPGVTARALKAIRADREDPVSAIAKIVADEKVTGFLVGFPFSEREGEIHSQIRNFAARLEQSFPNIPLEFFDESESSLEAEALLQQFGIRRHRHKDLEDSQAAKLVLLRYLNRLGVS